MTKQPCARAIYWRAKPGQLQAYSAYLQAHVEPVDEEASRQGTLRSFMTLVDATPGAPWSHMRLFVFDSHEERSNMLSALSAASATVTPDPAERAERAAHAATLRDRVGEADFDLLTPD
jgi:hypothetical protein